jgi:hypothetical protein
MEQIEGQKVTENIYYCPDGKYRWIYELNMLKNPVILMTIWKIFGILILVQIVLSFLLEVFEGDISTWFTEYLLTPGFLIVPGILFTLSLISYVIIGFIYGWQYIVLFEMDHHGVDHIQMPKQFEKAQGLAWLTAMAGLATGNFTTAGSGILAGSKSTSSSTFANVKKVIGQKSFHCIKVNEILEKNQIYIPDEDYEFVWNFITSRCPNATIKW